MIKRIDEYKLVADDLGVSRGGYWMPWRRVVSVSVEEHWDPYEANYIEIPGRWPWSKGTIKWLPEKEQQIAYWRLVIKGEDGAEVSAIIHPGDVSEETLMSFAHTCMARAAIIEN